MRKMKKGEIALVTIHPQYAFGSSDSSQDLAVVPANSTVYYEVELVSFVKVCLKYSFVTKFLTRERLIELIPTFVIAGKRILGPEQSRRENRSSR